MCLDGLGSYSSEHGIVEEMCYVFIQLLVPLRRDFHMSMSNCEVEIAIRNDDEHMCSKHVEA